MEQVVTATSAINHHLERNAVPAAMAIADTLGESAKLHLSALTIEENGNALLQTANMHLRSAGRSKRSLVFSSDFDGLDEQAHKRRKLHLLPPPSPAKTPITEGTFTALPMEIIARICQSAPQPITFSLMATCKKYKDELPQHLRDFKLRINREFDWFDTQIKIPHVVECLRRFQQTPGLHLDFRHEVNLAFYMFDSQ